MSNFPPYIRISDIGFRLVDISKDNIAKYFIDNGEWEVSIKQHGNRLSVHNLYYEIKHLKGAEAFPVTEEFYRESAGRYFKPCMFKES